MIADHQTDFLYLADTLPKFYPAFYKRCQKVLHDCNISFQLLPGTKDVWAVDYMPVQVKKEKFVRFVYNPKYLQGKADKKYISDSDAICQTIGIETFKSDIVLDAGNVVKSENKVIITERVFEENSSIERESLIQQLKSLFETEEVIFIPEQPYDFTGHADGMIRFVNDDVVVINDFKNEDAGFQKAFMNAIEKAGLEFIKLPYNPYQNKNDIDAKGTYINYLQMKDVVLIPVFGLKEDGAAVYKLEEIFEGSVVKTIDSTAIARDGGVLNCISWNILK